MSKDFTAGLYSALFFLLLFCISGCNIAGGGFGGHAPPEKILCDTPWVTTMKFSVWPVDPKEKYGNLAQRYKDVTIHIRDSVNNNFIAVPMNVENVNPEIGKINFKANMKPISCNEGIEYVEYYIDEMFDSHYNRTKSYKIPVSK